ncbi:hypothetical protein HHK36_011049 [Tetracentron sinense]|uniref:non-specific serine/threonine protein kinase n=1 Tax=Tetracentron sinense TaxID=13715 RepID=A0A834ZBB7_TETSI|nr:hypothetical protein HHK36_011049 [Tetracentron sinense]
MILKLFVLLLLVSFAASDGPEFIFNGFHGANLSLDGAAEITPNGLLRLTNTSQQQKGHAFYPISLPFKTSSKGNSNTTTLSFSTVFVFAIFSKYPELSFHGLAFTISPLKAFPGAASAQYLGLFNDITNGKSSNHVVAIELDTFLNSEFDDINNNHVGIDINSLRSNLSAPATFFNSEKGVLQNISLTGQPLQIWVEYNGVEKHLNVTLSPINMPKPKRPLLSLNIDLSPFILDTMYVGFSSSTGAAPTYHYILGWSFKMNGKAQELKLSRLPRLPRDGPRKKPKVLTIGLPLILVAVVLVSISVAVFMIRRRIIYAEVLEDWETKYGPHRFKYKDLYIATKGFREKEVLGVGGFGKVYRGVLPTSKIEVAVKRVSHESRQGIREFIAEIVSIGRLRHRNLVQLLGYCRRRRELLLVYDFMPNGSLDKFLFDQTKSMLEWCQRFQIIKGVASGLLYLHEEWEQVVVHRDVKASNVLLDDELNARLGDFGLARLYDHGSNPQTTHVVGTLGYMAPELTRTSKATMSTDVFAFGAVMLEVACGRRPIELQASLPEETILVDWVSQCWRKGTILEASDPKLGSHYVVEEMKLVLTLGLLCSHPVSAARPSMRQVMQILDGDIPLPELLADGSNASILVLGGNEGLDYYSLCSSVPDSLLSGGR